MKVCIFDCDTDRGSNLKDSVEDTGYQAVARDHVWDTSKLSADPKPAFDDVRPHFWEVDDESVVFIHHNNKLQYYWQDFLNKQCADNWVVMYSGGGLDGGDQRDSKRLSYPEAVGTQADPPWYLKDFLDAVDAGASEPFNKLLGVDPVLEVKLNLLHKLLVPPAELDELKEWKELEEEIQNDPEEQLQSYEEAWETYKENGQTNDDLEDFRDKLLATAL